MLAVFTVIFICFLDIIFLMNMYYLFYDEINITLEPTFRNASFPLSEALLYYI